MAETVYEFRLPDVGEGLEEAEIVDWKVVVGQRVEINQPLVEIETAKSLVELPSPRAGVVVELVVPAGRSVRVGTPIVRIGTAVDTANDATADDEQAGQPTGILVGSGPRADGGGRRGHRAHRLGRQSVPTSVSVSTPGPAQGGSPSLTPTPAVSVLATPPVRKLARTLGVDLATVTGTGPGGRVSRADVETAARSGARAAQPPSAPTATGVRETRIPIRGVRRETARAMVTSAFTAPHVTEFVTVDVTESMRLLDRLRTRGEFARLRLSPLTLLARAMCVAAPRTPEINSHWDDAAQQIVLRHYVNLGIATSTERGLLVPNIRDADRLSFVELARAITGVVDTARRGRCTPEQVTGGTMSITNVGVFGIDSGTPILPPGQSAIVCLGVVAQRPWVVDGELSVRQVTTLGLSFDHRLVDGAQASRFLGDVAAMLTDPGLAVALS